MSRPPWCPLSRTRRPNRLLPVRTEAGRQPPSCDQEEDTRSQPGPPGCNVSLTPLAGLSRPRYRGRYRLCRRDAMPRPDLCTAPWAVHNCRGAAAARASSAHARRVWCTIRRAAALLAGTAAAAVLAAAAPSGAAAGTTGLRTVAAPPTAVVRYAPPLPALLVVRGFDPPATRYGAGSSRRRPACRHRSPGAGRRYRCRALRGAGRRPRCRRDRPSGRGEHRVRAGARPGPRRAPWWRAANRSASWPARTPAVPAAACTGARGGSGPTSIR